MNSNPSHLNYLIVFFCTIQVHMKCRSHVLILVLIDMQVLDDVIPLKTHMHNTKTKPYSSCKGIRGGVGLTRP